jgi:hypothetical protein
VHPVTFQAHVGILSFVQNSLPLLAAGNWSEVRQEVEFILEHKGLDIQGGGYSSRGVLCIS